MNKLRNVCTAVCIGMLLQACGGSSKSTTNKVETTKLPIKEFHLIQPDKIDDYIADFKTQNAQVELQFEGVQYTLAFYDFGAGQKSVVAEFEKGLVTFGFNPDKNEPEKTLAIVIKNQAGDSVLKGANITLTPDGDNFIYDGNVKNVLTQDVFNVRMIINESFFGAGNSSIEVLDNTATLNGTLGTETYIQMNELIKNNTNVDTLILQEIDGSVNDAINMHTGRLIRNAKLTTVVKANGDINSGGVDLFAAGFKREYNKGGKVGVHSWCCVNGKSAHLLSRDDAEHGAQLTFFRELLGDELGPEFYFFTLNAAPASDIHVMTQTELDKYLITK